jgi:hypothetical protein
MKIGFGTYDQNGKCDTHHCYCNKRHHTSCGTCIETNGAKVEKNEILSLVNGELVIKAIIDFTKPASYTELPTRIKPDGISPHAVHPVSKDHELFDTKVS